jgi:hypothetical protein
MNDLVIPYPISTMRARLDKMGLSSANGEIRLIMARFFR